MIWRIYTGEVDNDEWVVTTDDFMDLVREEQQKNEEVVLVDGFSQFRERKEKKKLADTWTKQYEDMYGHYYTPEYQERKQKIDRD
ncbi:hypothetical protein ACIQD3_22090 [Peribacillus loiseleuriae]|uniref:hypothetical protein n=1 Tax=Peribacillus loiseleuriae TaxID=1679170 RepID=UPI0038105FDB